MPDEAIILRGVATVYKVSGAWRMACWPNARLARTHARQLLIAGRADHVYIAHLPKTQLAAAEFFLGVGVKEG